MNTPGTVGVYGGGRMGAGIAHAFLVAGAGVIVVEVDDQAAAGARRRIMTSLSKAAERGALDDRATDQASREPRSAETLLERLRVTRDPSRLSACLLVVEAVPENLTVKSAVLKIIASFAPAAMVATNTSSLSIDSLARATADPSRFLGLHFFNPVPASDLVEIVVGSATSPETLSAAQTYVAALGKTAIVVADAPGFASSRLGVTLALEAMRMLEEGVASAADIDTAMTLGYRHPTGPLRTTDLVGLDVRLAIAEHLERELGPRFAPPQILRDKVRSGQLGRKTGQGFYSW